MSWIDDLGKWWNDHFHKHGISSMEENKEKEGAVNGQRNKDTDRNSSKSDKRN